MKNKSSNLFFIIWIGQLISSIGSGLTAFSLGIYVYQKTQIATSFALMTLCAFLPSILLRPVGGVLVDRFDRRTMMMIGDLGSAIGIAFILLMMLQGDIDLWQIYLGVTASSVFVALQNPAYKASVTDLLEEDQFSKASGLIQLTASAQYLFSPVIAGFLLSMATIETVLIINIATFIVAIAAVLLIPKASRSIRKNAGQRPFLKDMKEGWHAVTANKGILLLVTVLSIVTFYIGILQTLFTPMLLAFAEPKTLGSILSFSATGILLCSLFIGVYPNAMNHAKMLVTGLGLAGLFFALVGATTNIYCIALACFLFFCALPFINTGAEVLIRKNISNDIQGRAWGIIGLLSQLGYLAAYSISGVMADRIFNPLLTADGLLVSSIGHIIGTGSGRGIGLLFIISGFLVMCLALTTSRIQSIRLLNTG